MRPRGLIWLAAVLWGFVVTSVAATGLLALADRAGTATQGGGWIYVIFTVFVLSFSTVGVLIVAHQPANLIGWLLLACAVGDGSRG